MDHFVSPLLLGRLGIASSMLCTHNIRGRGFAEGALVRDAHVFNAGVALWWCHQCDIPRHVFWGPVCAKKKVPLFSMRRCLLGPFPLHVNVEVCACGVDRPCEKKIPNLHKRLGAAREPTLTNRGKGYERPCQPSPKWNVFSHIPE